MFTLVTQETLDFIGLSHLSRSEIASGGGNPLTGPCSHLAHLPLQPGTCRKTRQYWVCHTCTLSTLVSGQVGGRFRCHHLSSSLSHNFVEPNNLTALDNFWSFFVTRHAPPVTSITTLRLGTAPYALRSCKIANVYGGPYGVYGLLRVQMHMYLLPHPSLATRHSTTHGALSTFFHVLPPFSTARSFCSLLSAIRPSGPLPTNSRSSPPFPAFSQSNVLRLYRSR